MTNGIQVQKEERLKGEKIFEGKLITVERDTVRLQNGKESIREVVRHPGAVAIVPMKEDEVLLVKQYRYPIEKITLEIPAGKLDFNEEPIKCAERELREETGYTGTLEYLGHYYSTPGFTDEVIHLYKATDLKWDPLTPDEDEFLNVETLPWEEAKRKALRGEFDDLKTMLGIILVAGNNRD